MSRRGRRPREAGCAARGLASSLPRAGTSEGQAAAALADPAAGRPNGWWPRKRPPRGADAPPARPSEDELLPDIAARLEIGSIAAAVLARSAGPRAVRPRDRRGRRQPTADSARLLTGATPDNSPPVAACSDSADSAPGSPTHLRGSVLPGAGRSGCGWTPGAPNWCDLAPGYEHPGDPRQPDNTAQTLTCDPTHAWPSTSAAPRSPSASSTTTAPLVHRAQLADAATAIAEAVWAVVDEADQPRRWPRRRRAGARSWASPRAGPIDLPTGHRQPDQYR